MNEIGKTLWVIPEGFIPAPGDETVREFVSHETACILNASDHDAHIKLLIYYTDKEPVGPYQLTIPARRTRHIRFNDLTDPVPIPIETDFACLIHSDRPIVVQHTRLDSRKMALALMTTTAYAVG